MKDNITASNAAINYENFEIDNDTLVSYSGNESTVAIPFGIKTIDNCAFHYNHMIKKVIIPEGVETIGYEAFKCCTRLKEVVFPKSLKSIGTLAFYECKSLRKIELKSVKTISNGAFGFCSNLEEIILPDTPILIGKAFNETKYYSDMNNWEDGLLYIGKHLIAARPMIGGHYYIKEGTIDIASETFFYCNHLREITIPNSVKLVGDLVFMSHSEKAKIHISDLTSWCNIEFCNATSNPLYFGSTLYLNNEPIRALVIPKEVKEIKPFAFFGFGGSSVTILEGTTRIGTSAFAECKNLHSVIISDTVKEIEDYAFRECLLLSNIKIGKSVKTIGAYAFTDTNLKSKFNYYKAVRIDENGNFYSEYNEDYKYEINTWLEKYSEIIPCRRGYHFCNNLFKLFNFYDGTIDENIAIFQCEIGDMVKVVDTNIFVPSSAVNVLKNPKVTTSNKFVTNTIKLSKRLTLDEILAILNQWD